MERRGVGEAVQSSPDRCVPRCLEAHPTVAEKAETYRVRHPPIEGDAGDPCAVGIERLRDEEDLAPDDLGHGVGCQLHHHRRHPKRARCPESPHHVSFLPGSGSVSLVTTVQEESPYAVASLARRCWVLVVPAADLLLDDPATARITAPHRPRGVS